ncbi:hypothetical protein AAFF_G00167020 [Aldrovandia affinis]|uniref:Uncharacterized protein n=1 Tax=Aldrovandia affinis TaxID=143900 RepID=A0AAD7RLZ7_9TELE|nr:hypothetical protein AAFF_G00167020 [Aldrovandia affinis]
MLNQRRPCPRPVSGLSGSPPAHRRQPEDCIGEEDGRLRLPARSFPDTANERRTRLRGRFGDGEHSFPISVRRGFGFAGERERERGGARSSNINPRSSHDGTRAAIADPHHVSVMSLHMYEEEAALRPRTVLAVEIVCFEAREAVGALRSYLALANEVECSTRLTDTVYHNGSIYDIVSSHCESHMFHTDGLVTPHEDIGWKAIPTTGARSKCSPDDEEF